MTGERGGAEYGQVVESDRPGQPGVIHYQLWLVVWAEWT